ncbi:tRNA(Glu)-specific nuclease WapA precursor [compost metagenome]
MNKRFLIVISLLVFFSLVFDNPIYAIEEGGVKEKNTTIDNINLFAPSKVEVIDERTLWSKKYLLENGDYQEEISLVPIHYEDEQGKFQDIDTQLIENLNIPLEVKPSKDSINTYLKYSEMKKKGKKNTQQFEIEESYSAYNVPYDINISKNIKNGYSIGKENEKITFIPIGAKSSMGKVTANSNNKIFFSDVWKNSDVELEVTNMGIKENIILKDRKAPKSFKFSIIKNRDNITKLDMLPSYLIDNNNTYRDIKTTIIEGENGVDILEISIDDTGLEYPITIDPTTTILPMRAIYVDSDYPNTGFSFNSTMKVQAYSKMSYLQFDLPALLKNKEITSATLQLYAHSITKPNNDQRSPEVESTQIYRNLLEKVSWTYNQRPNDSWYFSGGSSDYATISSPGFYNFDIKFMLEKAKALGNEHVLMMMTTTSSSLIEFTTPYTSDINKFPKLIVTYGIPSPRISNVEANMSNSYEVEINWNVSEVPGSSQTKFEVALLKKMKNSSYMEVDRANQVSTSMNYIWSFLPGGGAYKFAIRTYNGEVWSEWGISNAIILEKGDKYVYDSLNRLINIIGENGTNTTYVYDVNGNLLSRSKIQGLGLEPNKLIADGNPIEWANKGKAFEDDYNDFHNTYIENPEPERDIRSVYYETDSDYLYIMIELGGVKDYEVLTPHGYDNDNYFIYLPANNQGITRTRNGSTLPNAVSYEIGSWHNDDVTVHTYDNANRSWKWSWTGTHSNDGLKSVKVQIGENPVQIVTSAILEMRIPLSYIPEADYSKMVVVAGSDKYDMDLAYVNFPFNYWFE